MEVIHGLNKESVISVEGRGPGAEQQEPQPAHRRDRGGAGEGGGPGRCRYNELPFQINRSRQADETLRLKYRYLDLRNPEVKKNIISSAATWSPPSAPP